MTSLSFHNWRPYFHWWPSTSFFLSFCNKLIGFKNTLNMNIIESFVFDFNHKVFYWIHFEITPDLSGFINALIIVLKIQPHHCSIIDEQPQSARCNILLLISFKTTFFWRCLVIQDRVSLNLFVGIATITNVPKNLHKNCKLSNLRAKYSNPKLSFWKCWGKKVLWDHIKPLHPKLIKNLFEKHQAFSW